MEDHPHGDDICLWKLVFEEVEVSGLHAARHTVRGDILLRYRCHGRKVHRGTVYLLVVLRYLHRQHARRSADINQCFETREVKLLRQRREIWCRNAGHGVDELFQLNRICIQCFEDRTARMFDFVLWLASGQCLFEVCPEAIEPVVRHFQQAAHVLRFVFIKEQIRFRRIEIDRRFKQAFPAQKAKSHQCIQEVIDAAVVQL